MWNLASNRSVYAYSRSQYMFRFTFCMAFAWKWGRGDARNNVDVGQMFGNSFLKQIRHRICITSTNDSFLLDRDGNSAHQTQYLSLFDWCHCSRANSLYRFNGNQNRWRWIHFRLRKLRWNLNHMGMLTINRFSSWTFLLVPMPKYYKISEEEIWRLWLCSHLRSIHSFVAIELGNMWMCCSE